MNTNNSIGKFTAFVLIIFVGVFLLVKLLPVLLFIAAVAILIGLLYGLNEVNSGRKTVDDLKIMAENMFKKLLSYIK